jgi:hypothetical protein
VHSYPFHLTGLLNRSEVIKKKPPPEGGGILNYAKTIL